MQATLLERKSLFDRSFLAEKHVYSQFLNVWHYHPEFELVYIQESTGTQFIGDSIKPFKPGDLILIGADLPHMWLNESHYFDQPAPESAKALTVHFRKDFAGEKLFEIPEFNAIKKLISRASNGINFNLPENSTIPNTMEILAESSGFNRFNMFVELLNDISLLDDYTLLSSDGFKNPSSYQGDGRIDKIYQFSLNNFQRNIKLEEVAELVYLNPTAFCRYFKKTTKKNYFRFLNEIRIGYACKLLLEENRDISEVGYACGFNNLSNFNRQFKLITKISPTAYIKIHKSHN